METQLRTTPESSTPSDSSQTPESNEAKKSAIPGKAIANIAVLVAVIALAVVGARLLGASWLKILTVGGLTLTFIVIAILGAVYNQFDEWIEKGFGYYFAFLGWMLVVLAPSVGIVFLNRGILTLPRTFQVAIFLLWGVLLAYAVSLVATERKRQKLFKRLEAKIGRFTPVAYSFNLLMIAIVFFSSVTYALAQDRFHRLTPTDAPVTAESIPDFYLWHFLEAVPLLKVNDTIGWKAPMKHDSRMVGWITLLFKLAVIIPVIACFASYWKNFGVSNSDESTARQWRRTARRAGRYTRRAGGSTYYRRTVRGYARSSR